MRRPWRLLLAGLPAAAATLALCAGTAAAGTPPGEFYGRQGSRAAVGFEKLTSLFRAAAA